MFKDIAEVVELSLKINFITLQEVRTTTYHGLLYQVQLSGSLLTSIGIPRTREKPYTININYTIYIYLYTITHSKHTP